MTANEKIKELIKTCGKNQKELAEYLKISKKTLDTKFYRGNFSTEDLIKISNFLNLRLAFVDSTQSVVFEMSGTSGE